MCCLIDVAAQGVDDVTLVVSATGTTKEEAVTSALRSAIEQAYGVFVSANTTILNDELVKDEIATVASGNVKSYTELESAALPNGTFLVSLQAVVSTQNLALYAKTKGASCEFAGATLMANLNLKKLNVINTMKAFENLYIQLKEISPYLFDHRLSLGEPYRAGGDYAFPAKLYVMSNSNTVSFIKLIRSTLNALSISASEAEEYRQILGSCAEATINSKTWYFPAGCKWLLDEITEMTDRAANNFIIESNIGTVYSRPEALSSSFWKSLSFYNDNYAEGFFYPSYIGSPPLFKSKKKNVEPKEHVPMMMGCSNDFNILIPVDKIGEFKSLEVKSKYDAHAQLSLEEDIKMYLSKQPKDCLYAKDLFSFLINSDRVYCLSIDHKGFHHATDLDWALDVLGREELRNRIIEFNCMDSSSIRATIEKFLSSCSYNYSVSRDGSLAYTFDIELNEETIKICLYDFEWELWYQEKIRGINILENYQHQWIRTAYDRF